MTLKTATHFCGIINRIHVQIVHGESFAILRQIGRSENWNLDLSLRIRAPTIRNRSG